MAKRDPNRRRHSKALDAMTAEQIETYRAKCVDVSLRLEDVLEWVVSEGISSSLSAVHRDSQAFRVAAACDRVRASERIAGQIAAASSGGDIAGTQAAASKLLSQMVLEFAVSNPTIELADVTKFANLCKGVAALNAAEVIRYREQVKQAAAAAAEQVRKTVTDAVPGRLSPEVMDKIDRAIFGIAGGASK